MKHFITLLIAAASIFTAAAQVKNYAPKIGDFNELTVNANINVVYKHVPDSAGFASYACAPEVAHAITFSRTKNKIKIEVDPDVTGELPTIVIYSNALSKITNCGDSLVQVVSPAECESFTAKVIGNGTMEVTDAKAHKINVEVSAGHGALKASGKAEEAKCTVAGVGSIDATGIECSKITCWMTGSDKSAIRCPNVQQLTVYGAGKGTVIYPGTPAIKKRALGVKLEQID